MVLIPPPPSPTPPHPPSLPYSPHPPFSPPPPPPPPPKKKCMHDHVYTPSWVCPVFLRQVYILGFLGSALRHRQQSREQNLRNSKVPDNLELSLKQVLFHMWKTWHLQQLVSWTQVIDNEASPETCQKIGPFQRGKGRKFMLWTSLVNSRLSNEPHF